MESIRLFENISEETTIDAPYVFSLADNTYVPSNKTVTAAIISVNGTVTEEKIEVAQPNNEIWYTTTDGNIFDVISLDELKEGLGMPENMTLSLEYTLLSNVYENGIGKLKFNKPIERIGLEILENAEGIKCHPIFVSPSENKLKTITLPNDLTVIGEFALNDCYNLEKVTIPNNVYEIGNYAFGGCQSLTSITIPSSVTKIGVKNGDSWSDTFFSSGLQEIIFESLTPPIWDDAITSETDDLIYDCKIFVPCNALDAYKTAYEGYSKQIECKCYTAVKQDDDSYKFYNDNDKTELSYELIETDDFDIFGDILYDAEKDLMYRIIKYRAYYKVICNDIEMTTTKFIYYKEETEYSTYKWYFDESFNENLNEEPTITLVLDNVNPNEIDPTIIGKTQYGFGHVMYQSSSNSNVIDYYISDKVDTIGNRAFHDLKLSEINLPNTIKRIEGGAFSNCNNITTLVIPSNVTEMGNGIFYNCKNLETIQMAKNYDFYEGIYSMFYNCQKLKELDCSQWDTSKATNLNYVFYKCYELETIGDISGWDVSNVSRMSCTFESCGKLTTIGNIGDKWNVTNKVWSIDVMFYECNSLTYIGHLSNWDLTNVEMLHYTFYGCNNLDYDENIGSWVIPKECDFEAAFYNNKKLVNIDISNWTFGTDPKDETRLTFCYDGNIQTIVMPDIKTIGTGMFYGCSSMKWYDFSRNTQVPYLGSSGYDFAGIPTTCEIRVPTALYDEWIAAPQWSNIANRIVAV